MGPATRPGTPLRAVLLGTGEHVLMTDERVSGVPDVVDVADVPGDLLSAAARLARHALKPASGFAAHWPWTELIAAALTRLQSG